MVPMYHYSSPTLSEFRKISPHHSLHRRRFQLLFQIFAFSTMNKTTSHSPPPCITAQNVHCHSGISYCSEVHVREHNTVFNNSQYCLMAFNSGWWGGGGERYGRVVATSGCSQLTDHKFHSPSTGIQHIPTSMFNLAVTWEMLCKHCNIFVQVEGRRGL